MVRQLLATTAIVVGLSAAAWADDTTQPPAGDAATVAPAAAPDTTTAPQPDPAAAPQDDAAATPKPETGAAPQGDTAAAPQPETGAAPQDTAAAPQPAAGEETAVGRATPGDGLITAQPDSHVRAGEIIGMSVVSAEGDEVGEVNDLIFDDQNKLTGMVVGVGGFLGIGEKWIGIDWTKAELRADPESGKERIFVGLTKADLEAAPDFKTKEQLKSDAESAAAQKQMDTQSQMPTPAPESGGTTTQ